MMRPSPRLHESLLVAALLLALLAACAGPAVPTPTPQTPAAVPVAPTLSAAQEQRLLDRAMSHYAAGEHDLALAWFDRLIAGLHGAARTERLAVARALRAETYLKQHRYEAALGDLHAAYALGQRSALVTRNLCRAHALLAEPRQARPYCEQAFAADPALAADSYGLALALLGDLEGAADKLQLFIDNTAVSPYPNVVDMRAERRVWAVMLRRGENPFTPLVLADLRAHDPVAGAAAFPPAELSLPAALNAYWHGRDLARAGDYAAAGAAFGAALALFPDFEEALVARGSTAVLSGRPQEALPDLDAALRLNPQDGVAYHWRGMARSELGLIETAVADFTAALRLNPQVSRNYHMRGVARLRGGDPQAALADFSAALLVDKENGEIWFRRAQARAALGQREAAISDLQQALALGLPRATAAQARELLRRLRAGEQFDPQTTF